MTASGTGISPERVERDLCVLGGVPLNGCDRREPLCRKDLVDGLELGVAAHELEGEKESHP